MYLPRLLRPRPRHGTTVDALAHTLLAAPLTTLVGPAGAYAAEELAAALAEHGRWARTVWLRADRRRAGLLAGELAHACRHRWPHANGDGQSPLDHPVAAVADALQGAPVDATVVIELGRRTTSGVRRLLDGLRGLATDRGVTLVVVTDQRADRVLLRGMPQRRVPVPGLGTAEWATLCPLVSRRHVDWFHGWVAHRPALARDLADAAARWPTPAIATGLEDAAWSAWWVALDQVTGSLLRQATSAQRAALEVCVATGYWHPQLTAAPLSVEDLRPWVVPLEDQWGWLRPVWRRPLARRLRDRPPAVARSRAQTPAAGSAVADRAVPVSLEARMLGPFSLKVDAVPVDVAAGNRGIAVLRYLLSQPGHQATRDQILEQFWPDVSPRLARNRLQAAVSGVRRVLRDVTARPVIEHRDGSYRIASAVRVTVDVARFEQALARARAIERTQERRDVIAAYRAAVDLYGGDFALDAPYEDWTLLVRERLRLRYLDALDRLGALQRADGRIDECIVTAHRMLDVDPCREDAHRLLMRCYADQGRAHQVQRQYELCRRALQATLDTEPSEETERVLDEIRAGLAA